MYETVLRLGLWTLILVLILFVASTSMPGLPFLDLISHRLMTQILIASLVLIAAGIVLKFLEKGKKVVAKNRCRVCRSPIVPGALYCREHLRSILYEEEDRTHGTHPRAPRRTS